MSKLIQDFLQQLANHFSLYLILTFCLFLTLGCSHKSEISSESEYIPKTHLSDQDNNSGECLKNTETFRGQYIYGHEVRAFILCSNSKELWVLDNTNGVLVNRYKALTSEPYQPIYVEVKGKITDAPEDGFGEDYPAAIIIEVVTHASRIEKGKECPDQ